MLILLLTCAHTTGSGPSAVEEEAEGGRGREEGEGESKRAALAIGAPLS